MERWRRKNQNSAFIGVFAFIVVVLIVAALFMALWWVLNLLNPEDEGAAFVVCLITAALAIVYQITNTRIIERKLPIEQERRAARAEVYQRLLSAIFASLGDQPGAARIRESELYAACGGGAQDVMVYASDEVVHCFGDLMNLRSKLDAEGAAGEARGKKILSGLERLLQAMRRDVGHDSGQLLPGNLKRVFIPDADTLLKEQ